MARIDPLSIEGLPAELCGIVETYRKTMGKVSNSFRTTARKPLIAKAYVGLQKAIAQSLAFPPELRSMMFLLQGQENGCLYCQAHSVSALARSNNVPEEKHKLFVLSRQALFSMMLDAQLCVLHWQLLIGRMLQVMLRLTGCVSTLMKNKLAKWWRRYLLVRS